MSVTNSVDFENEIEYWRGLVRDLAQDNSRPVPGSSDRDLSPCKLINVYDPHT